jgi:hypothetical protein
MGKVLERFWGFSQPRKGGLSGGMKILDLGLLRGCCQSLPDLRQGSDVRYTMADMSAFSLFFLQSPSFLAHQRRLEAGQGRLNCQTLFGPDRVPSDNHIQALLDPVSPDHFHPVFTEVVAELEGSGGLEAFRLPIKLPRSTGSIATHFQSHLELLVRNDRTLAVLRRFGFCITAISFPDGWYLNSILYAEDPSWFSFHNKSMNERRNSS